MRKRSENIGIAMATYNGAKNLQVQLDSLLIQTMSPAEVVICDDGSNDETISILHRFQTVADFPVKFSVNPRSLGPTENFFHAASRCRSQYIALCDQDDIWLEHKIEICDAVVQKTRPSLILHSMIDFYRDPLGTEVTAKIWQLPDKGLIPGFSANPSLIWPGMSMVANRELFSDVVPMQIAWRFYLNKIRDARPEILYIHWADMHDLFLLTRARLNGSIFLIGDVCAKHRTRDGGYHSDPKGPGLRRVPEIEAAWGSSRARPYKLWSLFCADFLDYLGDIDSSGSMKGARAYFERWSHLWWNRALIHSEESSFATRLGALRANLNDEAYASEWAGGFGWRSLVKDGIRSLGFRFSSF